MDTIDPARWPQLSALLDELLDLDPQTQAARLAAMRADEPRLADELARMLVRMQALDDAAFLEAPAVEAPAGLEGQTVGAYTLERELGQGGMGSVWLARRTDGRYEGRVAIKFLQAGLFGRSGAARFAREGSILARLDHPHIARLLDAGLTPDGHQPYLVLEYIDGEPIDRHCSQRGLGTQAIVRLFLDVLAAVAHAHTRLILHRDLKPSNILVTAAGEVKLLDFGIAKLLDDATRPGAVTELTKQVGNAYTPHFATPEQIQGAEVTTATDVYALGVLLYLLLSGRHPTIGEAAGELDRLRAVIEVEPRRLSEAVLRQGQADAPRRAREIRGDLDTIVAKALKKAPGERYANAADLADDLRRWLALEPVAARPDSPAYRLGRFVRRNRLAVAAGSLAALGLAIGLGVALQQGLEARRQQVQAEGLIEFMLGDLRKKLAPDGRLDALDAVGEKALAYYAAQRAGRLDADSLGRRARALHLIGELAEKRGQLDKAARGFNEAAEATAALLAREPSNSQRLFDQAQSEYWVGYIAWRRGEQDVAEAAFGRYLALAQQLGRIDPANPDWRAELAWAHQNLGVLYLKQGRFPQALTAFGTARSAWDGVVALRAAMWVEMGNTLGWLAATHEAMGDQTLAIEVEQQKVAALAKVPGHATDRHVQFLLALADQVISRRQLALGRLEPAAQAIGLAIEQFTALTTHDPANLEWQGGLATSRLLAVELAVEQGDAERARSHLAAVDAVMARLSSASADKVTWQVYMKGNWLFWRARTQPAQAGLAPELDAFLASMPRYETDGKALDAEQGRAAARAGLVLGDLRRDSGQAEAARHAWQAALARLQGPVHARSHPSMLLRASLLLRMGALDEAAALNETLQSSGYRHPALSDLRLRLAQMGRPPHSP